MYAIINYPSQERGSSRVVAMLVGLNASQEGIRSVVWLPEMGVCLTEQNTYHYPRLPVWTAFFPQSLDRQGWSSQTSRLLLSQCLKLFSPT